MDKDVAKAWIEELGLIPVLRANSIPEAIALAEAIVSGGVTIVEVTMTVPNACEVLGKLKRRFGSAVLLGAGTIISVDQCAASIAAGAEFIVSPSLHPAVVATTKELGKVSIPGALTPTEAITAWNEGADYVKIFPCSAMGGASYIRSLKAPFPQLQLIPTGGVTLQTAADFLVAGAVALGIGADLVSQRAITDNHPELITETARAYLDLIASTRKLTIKGSV